MNIDFIKVGIGRVASISPVVRRSWASSGPKLRPVPNYAPQPFLEASHLSFQVGAGEWTRQIELLPCLSRVARRTHFLRRPLFDHPVGDFRFVTGPHMRPGHE